MKIKRAVLDGARVDCRELNKISRKRRLRSKNLVQMLNPRRRLSDPLCGFKPIELSDRDRCQFFFAASELDDESPTLRSQLPYRCLESKLVAALAEVQTFLLLELIDPFIRVPYDFRNAGDPGAIPANSKESGVAH